MAKLVSISNDVYENLSRLKGEESYSVVIRKLLRQRTNKEELLAFCGKGGVNPEKIKELGADWKRWSDRYA